VSKPQLPHLAAISSLQSLNLSGNFFEADSAAVHGPHLAAISSLQSLDLSYGLLKCDGVAVLGPHLAALSSLKSLNLAYNGFEADGIIHVHRWQPESRSCLDNTHCASHESRADV
jgi:Ran GTPase-activating protein (RanGAP) involved in mRNA processing and transport